jgi:hypothetical protein
VAVVSVVGTALWVLRMESGHVTCRTLFEVGNYHSLKAFEEKFAILAVNSTNIRPIHPFIFRYRYESRLLLGPFDAVDFRRSGNTFLYYYYYYYYYVNILCCREQLM